jgi:hypothetical protein
MNKLFSASILTVMALSATTANAEKTRSSFFTNDYIGDGHDRWRSGGYTLSYGFEGDKIGTPFNIQLRSEIISAWGSSKQADDDDRLYVGAIGIGAFVTKRYGFTDINFGGEILAIGDQTGVAKFQGAFHDLIGISGGYNPGEQPHSHLADAFTGTLSAEAAMNYYIGSNTLVRPFVAGQYGYETFLRAGADVVIGNMSNADRWLRDPVSGFIQPSSSQKSNYMGDYSLVAGFDVTTISESTFFPDHGDVELEPMRIRSRLGLQKGIGNKISIFYGATHLTKEFSTQYEGQTVGTISIEYLF